MLNHSQHGERLPKAFPICMNTSYMQLIGETGKASQKNVLCQAQPPPEEKQPLLLSVPILIFMSKIRDSSCYPQITGCKLRILNCKPHQAEDKGRSRHPDFASQWHCTNDPTKKLRLWKSIRRDVPKAHSCLQPALLPGWARDEPWLKGLTLLPLTLRCMGGLAMAVQGVALRLPEQWSEACLTALPPALNSSMMPQCAPSSWFPQWPTYSVATRAKQWPQSSKCYVPLK